MMILSFLLCNLLLIVPTVSFLPVLHGQHSIWSHHYASLLDEDNGTNASNHNYWQSHVSTHSDAFNAFKNVWYDVTHKDQMDLAFLFVGQAHASDFEALVQHAKIQFSGANTQGKPIRLLSILGGGVIGENVELDQPERPSHE